MKKPITVILLLAGCFLFPSLSGEGQGGEVFGQTPEAEKGIQFDHGTFAELLARAKKENKMIFLDAYTTWCGPCKWMVKNVFPNDTAAAFYNKNFVNAKIDMEKGEGIGLAKKYNISCYPTYLFIDGNGQMIHRTSSAMPVKEFVQLGATAMDPAKQFSAFQKKYNAGGMSPGEMGEFILMKGGSCLSVKEEMVKYFSTQKEVDLTSKLNWKILNQCRMDITADSREFKYLVDHRAEYEKLYAPEAVGKLIESSYSFALRNCIREKNTDGYNKLREEILKKNLSFSEEMVMNSDMEFHKANNDLNRYAAAAEAYINKFGKDNSNLLNNISWAFYESIEDKALLAKAEGWAKRSVELDPGYYNYDTYAAVLFKLGKKSEAQAAAEKAIELAKKSGDDFKETEAMLEKIKALK